MAFSSALGLETETLLLLVVVGFVDRRVRRLAIQARVRKAMAERLDFVKVVGVIGSERGYGSLLVLSKANFYNWVAEEISTLGSIRGAVKSRSIQSSESVWSQYFNGFCEEAPIQSANRAQS